MTLASTLFWLTLTVYHEARGESPEGQRAVAKVILNRAAWKRVDVETVVTAPKQFSCFNLGTRNPAVWIKDVLTMASVAYNIGIALDEWNAGDTLGGATHYYAIAGMEEGKPPYWSKDPDMHFIREIGGHRFFKEG